MSGYFQKRNSRLWVFSENSIYDKNIDDYVLDTGDIIHLYAGFSVTRSGDAIKNVSDFLSAESSGIIGDFLHIKLYANGNQS